MVATMEEVYPSRVSMQSMATLGGVDVSRMVSLAGAVPSGG